MNKKLRALQKLFSLISGFSLIFNSLFPAGVLSLLFTPTAVAAEPEATDLTFNSKTSNFTLTVNAPTDNNPVDYVLSYFKTNTQTVEGVQGSGVTQLTRDILAGTCSGNTCIPHPFNRALTKVVIDEGATKWCEVKEYTYDGSLAKKDETVISCSDSKGFTTLTDSETTWLKTGETATPTPTPTTIPTSTPTPTQEGQILDGATTEVLPTATPTPTPTVAPSTEQHGSITAAIVKNTNNPNLNLDSQNVLGSATLTTNKPDYAPTDIVVISGNGFVPKHPYKLFISSTDPPAVNFQTEIKTDDTGSFIYSYQLDGNYRPNYTVTVNEGNTVVTTTTFTDSGTASDGAGTMTVSPTSIAAASTGNTLTFIFTSDNGKDFNAGSETTILVPTGWTAPTSGNVAVTLGPSPNCTAATLGTITGTGPWTIPINMTCPAKDQFTVTFSNVTAPAAALYTFTTQTKQSGGTLTNIASSPSITVTSSASPQLIVDGAGTGNGTITSNDSHFNCTSTAGVTAGSCSFTYSTSNPAVTLTAAASAGSSFSGWSGGGCSGTGTCSPTGLTGTSTVTVTATFDTSGSGSFGPISDQNIACMNGATGLVCTANDIQIASVSNVNIVAKSDDGVTFTPASGQNCDYPGQYIKFTASWHVQSTATSRYNVGLWFANHGQSSALSGMCSASTLPGSPSPFFEATDDVCGDIHSGPEGIVSPDITVVAQCNAAPGTNQLNLPYCASWNNQEKAGNKCSGPSGTTPETGSKCNCNNGFTIPITVPPAIKVVKSLSPTNDPGLFNLQVNGSTAGTGANVGNGGTTGEITVSSGSNSVGETAGTSTNLSDYNSTISCVDQNNSSVTTSGTGPSWTLSATNGQNIVCTITNTRNPGTLTVNKVLVPSNDSGKFNLQIDGGTAGTGANVGDGGTTGAVSVSAGSHTVGETAGTATTLSNYTSVIAGDCASDGTVTVPSGGAKVCTITNTLKSGSIKIVKNTTGGNGTFDFTIAGPSPSTPSVVTSGGTGNTGLITVNAGSGYSVAETVPSGWNLDSSSCDSGTPASFTVPPGGTVTCTFNDTKLGKIIVQKDMVGGTDDFVFTDDVAGTISVSGGQLHTDDVLPGTYTSTEAVTAGWDLTGLTCDDGRSTTPSTVDLSTHKATFKVDPGETVTCTFTNTKRGHLVVQKTTTPSADPTEFSITATGNGTITGGGAGIVTDATDKDYEVTPGTYSVTETVPGNWTQNSNNCTDVVVAAGQTATCQIVNTKKGNVTVTKYLDHNANGVQDGGDEVLDTWNINLDQLSQITGAQVPGSGQVTFSDLVPGSYTLSEVVKDGWHQSNISCTGDTGIDNDNSHTVTVTAGQTTNCSIGNYQNGTITVTKRVLNPDGGAVTDTSTHFHFTVDQTGTNPDLTDDESQSFSVSPGTHTVVETPDQNYDFVSCLPDGGVSITNGTSATVASGETVNIECTNKQKKATITVVKDVVKSDGSPVLDNHTFTALLNGANGKSFSENSSTSYSVNPGGPYTVGEGPDDNYTLVGCKLPSGANATEMNLATNGSVTVTCTNKQNPGTISGHKLMADGLTGIVGWVIDLYSCVTSGTDCSFVTSTPTGTGGSFSFTNLVTGFYQIREALDPNYTPMSVTSHDVTVTPGSSSPDNDFSNFKNIDITVCKKSDADGNIETTGDQNVLSGWTMTLLSDGKQLGDTQTTNRETGCTTFSNLGPDHDYSVTETLQEGWKNITPLTHDFGTPVDGVNQSYTFYNQQLGHIVIAKVTDPTQDLQGFNFTLTGGASSLDQTFGLTDGTNHDSGYVIPGDGYNASETVPTGWDQTSATCDNDSPVTNISVAAGQTTTCTFTNTKRGTIIVQKDMIGDTGSFDFTGDVAGTIDTNGGQLQTTNVIPGTYSSTETAQTGWDLTDLTCDDGESQTPSTTDSKAGTATFKVDPGETVTCTFTNTKRGGIIIHKIIDADGNLETTGDQTDGVNWLFDITGQTDISGLTTDTLGTTSSGPIVTGNYDVTENVKAGYDLIDAQCDSGENGSQDGNTIYSVNVNPGQTVNCTFINSPNGKIHGYKWNDINGNGIYDCTNGEFPNCEDKLPGWTIFLDSNNNGKLDQGEPSTVTQTGNELGWYVFDHLFPGTYHVCEVGENGWAQTSSPTCHTIQVPTGENTCGGTEQNSILAPACNFGNKLQNPILTITKENNTGGADRHPGDSVLYTLTVTATQSAAFNVEVTDLLPAGFTYQAGSWTSNSSVRGNLKPGTTTEPTYHSPGVWKLGNMVVGEVVTLTYVANISGDQQSGLYHDLAWASGCRTSASCTVLDSNSVLSNATDPGFVDEHYVGTQVNIVREPNENVNLTVQGQVLGASTELPATGASVLWLYIAFGLITSGLTFGALGWYIRRRHE